MNQPIVTRLVSHGEASVNGVTRRAWAAAVVSVANSGDGSEDLPALTALGESLGDQLGQLALKALNGQATAYGKSAIVGSALALETAAAILHPKLGRPLRALLGGGKALIPSTIKKAGPGASIDVPLHGKDNEWDFSLLDAIAAGVSDAPCPTEIVVVVALASGGRAGARIGVE